MDSRREFLKKAALLSGGVGVAGSLPSSIAKAFAINAAEGSTYLDAEHVVILMQENRSFDHTFGTLQGVRGYNDPRAIDLPNGNPVWLQSDKEGNTFGPFHMDIKNTKSTWMHSLPHSWNNQVNARNDGKHDKWIDEKHSDDYKDIPLTMGYHNRGDIPFYYALADAFTICDQHFCSSLAGTNPNRLYFWSGTVRAEQNENSRAHVWNEDMDYGTLNWPTFPERLEDHNISWKHYQNEVAIDVGFQGEEDAWLSNYQDNPLEFFSQYNVQLHQKHIDSLKNKHKALQVVIEDLKKQNSPAQADLLRQREDELSKITKKLAIIEQKPFDKLTDREKALHLKAFVVNRNDPDYHTLEEITYNDNGIQRKLKVPKGDVLHQFREDVKSGKLPTVSWLSSPENFSDHPSAPWYGAWYVSEVLDILTQNPEVWKKTIFILTYDENDGYFDHVPPFVAPHSHKDGTGKVSAGIDTRVEFVTLEQELDRKGFPEKYERESSIGLGFRVPMVIASPWSKGGFVNSEVCDHTSTLQFLEKFLSHKTGKKVSEPNISDWRRTVCGDLTSAFRTYNAERLPLPKFLNKTALITDIHKAQFKGVPNNFRKFSADDIKQIKTNKPGSLSLLPQQEKGTRPSCALPYQLYADGKLTADRSAFQINFASGKDAFGDNSAGASFIVYAPGKHKSLNGSDFELMRNWCYTVKAGDTINDSWLLNDFDTKHYLLKLYGANGFYREFKGDAADPQLETTFEYERNKLHKNTLTGNVIVVLTNANSEPCTVTLTDNAYKSADRKKELAPHSKSALILDLSKSHNWYDFSIRVNGHKDFERRYAGKVETGKAGYTDPFMGRVV